MNNNKGQVLITFVLLLPLFMLFLIYIFDISNINYEKKKIKNIGEMVLKKAKEDNLSDEEIKEYINKNDSTIVVSINRNSNVKILMTKEMSGLFSKYVDISKYRIKVIVE